MRESWPHAPPHYFTPGGTYIITAATVRRKQLFDSAAKRDLLRNTTFERAKNYALILQAWAFFHNHYHLVISFEDAKTAHRNFIRHLHRGVALRLNRVDGTLARRVMYEFWDTHLTYEKSWLAPLNYVHQNAVKYGLVPVANQYPWCSAPWFESNARSGFVKSVYSFKTDRINVPDDFGVASSNIAKARRRRIALPKHFVQNTSEDSYCTSRFVISIKPFPAVRCRATPWQTPSLVSQ
jgi:putative transposase